MNNLEMRINSLEMELAELKKLVKKEEVQTNKVWMPEKNENYYAIGFDCKINGLHNNSLFDKSLIDYGNYFKTEEEAQKQAEYNRVMNRFRKYCEAYSEPLDWSDDCQLKYYVCFNCSEDGKILKFDNYNQVFKSAFQIYASSEQILKDAIIYSAGSEKEFKRIVFGVEK